MSVGMLQTAEARLSSDMTTLASLTGHGIKMSLQSRSKCGQCNLGLWSNRPSIASNNPALRYNR
eukprot:854481-Amphidinium_carterae.2